jgi:RNA polymerase sigma-B factor
MSTDTQGATMAAVTCGPEDDLDALVERYAGQRRSVTGDPALRLRADLIGALLPFADRLARRYYNSREHPQDLQQVARVGLVKAVDRYESGCGSFTAFAVATISGELKRYFRDHTWGVHVPRRLQDLARAVGQAEGALAAELRRRPTDREVAERCQVGRDDVVAARQSGAGYRPVSLSLPVGESGGQLSDMFGGPDEAVEGVADRVSLRELIERLPAREREILLNRFYGNRTQSEIARDLNISQMHVSRLLTRTLGWLRASLLSDAVVPWPSPDPDAEDGPVVGVRTQPDRIRVIVAGEIDRDNAGRLRASLLDVVRRTVPGRRVELDLRQVPLVDAAAVGVLRAVHDAARVRGITVTAAGVQPFVRRTMVIAGAGAIVAPDPGLVAPDPD